MSATSDIIDDLRTIPCLSDLSEKEISVIADHVQVKKFYRNDILFREFDRLAFIFVVSDGRIKLFKTSSGGRELVIKIVGPHEYFCCAPVYLDGTYPVSAEAMEDSTLVVIPVKYFKEMISSSVSSLGIRIISGLCNRIKYLSILVEDLSFKDVEQRIVTLLLRMAEEKSPDQSKVYLTLTHQDIAAMTGTVREVVSRTMSKLKKEKVVTDSSVGGFTLDINRLSQLKL